MSFLDYIVANWDGFLSVVNSIVLFFLGFKNSKKSTFDR